MSPNAKKPRGPLECIGGRALVGITHLLVEFLHPDAVAESILDGQACPYRGLIVEVVDSHNLECPVRIDFLNPSGNRLFGEVTKTSGKFIVPFREWPL